MQEPMLAYARALYGMYVFKILTTAQSQSMRNNN